jgi:5'-nucleotidase
MRASVAMSLESFSRSCASGSVGPRLVEPMTFRKCSVALLTFALASAVLQRGDAQAPQPVEVQVLAINDFHGNLEPPGGTNGLINTTLAGGAEYLATHLKNAVRENPNSIVVAAGDLIGASPLLSGLFHDGPTIEAANAMGLALTSIGNHELDHGISQFTRVLEGGCLKENSCADGEISAAARFRYLAANMVREGTGELVLPAIEVRTTGGVKIGFIGETLLGTPQMLTASSTRGLRFLEESAAANAAAAKLEKEGVRAIVLLIHQGGRQGPSDAPADPNGCANFSGPIIGIAERLSPSIKVVISGHSHQFYNCNIAGHIVTSASSYGRMYTRVRLTIDAATGAVLNAAAKNEIVSRDVPKSPEQTAIIARFLPEAERLTRRMTGSIAAAILSTDNAAGESALGDVIADAQLASMRAPEKGGGQIAFMNSGGIRADIDSTAATGRTVSFGDLYAVQPFGNRLMVVTMTGESLRRLLEEQFRPGGRKMILQVSEGFRYEYKLNAAERSHVVPGSITLNSKPIGAADEVRVIASDFLISGGGGYPALSEGRNAIIGPTDIDALVEYFATHSPVSPGPKNRIVPVD